MTVSVGLKLHDVSDVGDLLRDYSTADRPVPRRLNPQLAPACLNICRWRIASSGNRAEAVAIAKVQRTELCFANVRGVREHGVKDWLKFAGRTRDDLQHFRCCRLLLQRLGQFLSASLYFVEQPCVLNRNHGLICEG